jgi:uncharacterized repeat protein (TIGR01451 family)
MRRNWTICGVVIASACVVGAWVQAQAPHNDEPAPLFAPGTLAPPDEIRPLSSDGAEEATYDPQVRPSSGTETPHIAARRSGGLVGRLQALRRTEEPEVQAAPSEPVALEAPTSTMRNVALPKPTPIVSDDEVANEETTSSTPALPSVLKRPAARPSTTIAEPPARPLASPSDAVVGNEAPLRVAPSRARISGNPSAAPSISSIPSANAVTTPRANAPQQGQSLAAASNAALAVDTSGPKAMTLGKPAIYTITVVNQGVVDAKQVYIAVNLPKHLELSNVSGTAGDAEANDENHAQRLMWKLDAIPGRGHEKLTLEVIPQTSDPVELAVEWTQAPPSTIASVEVLEPKLAMTLKGPKEVMYGETAVYQIIVANPGTGDAEAVTVNVVSEDASEADAKQLGTIAAGQQKTIEVSMTASQAGSMKMHFAARSGELMTEASEDVLVRREKLEAAITGPALVFAGSEATYTVELANTGDAPASEVLVGVLLPEGSKYLGGIAAAEEKSGQLIWSAGAVAPGKRMTFEFTCTLNEAGTIEVPLQLQSGELITSAAATTKVEAVADLKLTVNDPQGPKPVGEEVIYEVTITNRGTKAARQVAVVVNFSDGIDPISVEGAKAEIGGGQALIDPIASIGAGESVLLKVKAQASKGGSHIFRAEVRCTDPETRLASEQTTRFFGSASPAAETANSKSSFVPSSGSSFR